MPTQKYLCLKQVWCAYVSMLEERGCGVYVSMLEDRGCGMYMSLCLKTEGVVCMSMSGGGALSAWLPRIVSWLPLSLLLLLTTPF